MRKLQNKKLCQDVRSLKNSEFVQEALNLGCLDAKIIMVESIITGHWVRLKCQYGCKSFANTLTCPPYSLCIEDMWDLLGEYRQGLLVKGESDEFVRNAVADLENKFVSNGFHKAFGLGSGACQLCTPCELENGCKYPDKARPSMTSCGIDVFKTVQSNGWKSSPLAPKDSRTEHFGLVLIN